MKGKVVLITGASSGIGAAAAKKFSIHEASLVLTGRNIENLKDVEKECNELGAEEVLTVVAEFQNMSDVKKVVDKTIDKFGRLDVLVNNSGTMVSNHFENVKLEDYDRLFQVNVRSVFYLTQLAIPHLIRSKGNVINVSSISSFCQFPHGLVYSMTKAALDQFTKTIALEYAPKGVRVNSVNPSNVETAIFREDTMTEKERKKFYEEKAKVHPTGTLGTVEEVADAIFFLSSESASWITGHCLTMDGGRTLKTP